MPINMQDSHHHGKPVVPHVASAQRPFDRFPLYVESMIPVPPGPMVVGPAPIPIPVPVQFKEPWIGDGYAHPAMFPMQMGNNPFANHAVHLPTVGHEAFPPTVVPHEAYQSLSQVCFSFLTKCLL
jgi:hypothetical protein